MIYTNFMITLMGLSSSLLYVAFTELFFCYIAILMFIASVFFNKTPITLIFKFFILSLFFIIPLVVMNIFFSTNLFTEQFKIVLFPFFILTFSSLIYSRNLDLKKLLHHFMIKRKITAKLGYILLIAVESISEIKEEWFRINYVGQVRKITGIKRFNFVFSLFIFSIRLSYRKALSLLSRGVSDDKLYYQIDKW